MTQDEYDKQVAQFTNVFHYLSPDVLADIVVDCCDKHNELVDDDDMSDVMIAAAMRVEESNNGLTSLLRNVIAKSK